MLHDINALYIKNIPIGVGLPTNEQILKYDTTTGAWEYANEGDNFYLGWYATELALTTAHPTGVSGNYAIVGFTNTIWIWDVTEEEWADSGASGVVTSVYGRTGAVVAETGDYAYSNVTNALGTPDIGTAVQAYASQLDTLSNIGTTKGDVMVFNGTSWVRVGVGANGQILTVNDTEATGVEWANPAGGGDMLASVYDPNGVENDAFDSANIANTPYGEIIATNVQAAINELELEKLKKTDGVQIFYVGKNGNDINDGLTSSTPFLTFGAAITASEAETPSSTNRYVIYCDDSGIYTEDLTISEWIGIHAPSVQITGNHIVNDNTTINAFRLAATSGVAVTKSTGTGLAIINCNRMILTNGTSGTLCNSGAIIYAGETLSVENGFGFGSISTGDCKVKVININVTGTGIGAGISSSGSLCITANCIDDTGSGTGLYAGATGKVYAKSNIINCNTACNVAAAGAAIYVQSSYLGGAKINNGTLEYMTTNSGFDITGDSVIDGNLNMTGLDLGTSGTNRTGFTGADTDIVTGTAGASGNLAEWDANGDTVDSGSKTSDFASASDLTTHTDSANPHSGSAASGANSDITSMTGLSDDGIPLAKVDGAASSGANSDITSITGLTTDLAVTHGGTGASNAAGAKTNLGFITDVVDDTTPQLGGNIDLNDKAIIEELVVGESVVAKDILYLKASDGKYWKADADAAATASTKLVMAIASIAADATGKCLVYGSYTTTGLTAGIQYVSTTPGAPTSTAPSATGDIVRIVGTAESTTILFFNPSQDFIELS